MKLGDLIKHLEKFDSNLDVGVSGYFGEYNEMDEIDFRVVTCLDPHNKKILHIETPYIGEEPD